MKLKIVLALAAVSQIFSARAADESALSILTNADFSSSRAPITSIIFIRCHGLGAGDLSCYGQTNFQTPNLDKLAAEGMRFSNFQNGGTNFTDALAALMSGKKSAGAKATTIAARLQNAGYHTGLIGEWTLDAQPWTRGFNEFAGFLNEDEGRNYYSDFLWRYAPGSIITSSNTLENWVGREQIYENEGGKKGKYLPEILINAMCNFVRINQPDRFNSFKPLFLLVDFPAPRSAKADADEFPVPSDAPFSDEPWPPAAKDRAALLTRVDGSIGRLFQQFRELGWSNNVAIFFSSSAPEKFADAKMKSVFRETKNQNAPMIVWWPEAVPAGQVSDFKWTGADFAPTALAIALQKPAKDLDGISILPVLQGKKGTPTDMPDLPKHF